MKDFEAKCSCGAKSTTPCNKFIGAWPSNGSTEGIYVHIGEPEGLVLSRPDARRLRDTLSRWLAKPKGKRK